MNFVSGLLRTRNNHDAILVIMDQLTKAAHFLSINIKYKLEKLADLYVSPVTRVGRALKSRKLYPKFIGLFEVLSRIGLAMYQIALPSNLSNLHPVFHVSQLRKYVPDPSHVIDLDLAQIRENLSYDVYLVRIADHRIKQLRGKKISLVKVI
ncbi:uncharacterized protein LOC113850774 [Abrus precatorius]|uniref:Uncharacterized protein LOC113850774 n=1 Tax=Abrus precatorius TaxID=3816 RepID=A0A8B8K275_ABRPR|nr:uncharacterized protein LOC113850774 [Abrus precatorius]